MDFSFLKLTELFSTKEEARLLTEGKWGLEMEAQRVTPSGDLALTPHPAVFGDKLENSFITTDFAESQVEMVTPPMDSVVGALEYLEKLQEEVENGIPGELLWPLSMPPRLPSEEEIPIARFNDTQKGRESEVYRSGLAARYGKKMQMISGIHFNFSLGDDLIGWLYERFSNGRDKRTFTDDLYFTVVRNYLRYRWLLIYLFGASPSADSSYYPVMRKEFVKVYECCPECCGMENHEDYSTSLRVSRFGYSNHKNGKEEICFDNLDEYLSKLRRLLNKRSRRFARLGVQKDGRQLQLNDHVLQKESEFYSSIRPKQIPLKGQTLLDTLDKYGVKYLEVRIFDLNPFERAGIGPGQLMFLQVFMLYCLFAGNKAISKREMALINKNHHLAALSGRKPGLKLYGLDGGRVGLAQWGEEIFEGLEELAALMDNAVPEASWKETVREERRKLGNPELLPSSRMMAQMREKGECFLEFGIRKAMENRNEIERSEAV